jgi:hypothetical protein
MKKICLSVVLIVFSFNVVIAQKIVKNDLYTVVYSEVYEQPLSLVYSYPSPFSFESLNSLVVGPDSSILARAKLDPLIHQVEYLKFEYEGKSLIGYYIDENGRITSKTITKSDSKELEITYQKATQIKIDTVITITPITKFRKAGGIKTSDHNDYALPYHKGHLVPKASIKDTAYDDEKWSFLNCALMHKDLNKGVWFALEDKERKIAKEALLKVSIILSFTPDSKVMDGGATVPKYFTKILEYRMLDKDENELVVREVYSFPNNSSVKGKKIEDYKVKNLSFELDTFQESIKH